MDDYDSWLSDAYGGGDYFDYGSIDLGDALNNIDLSFLDNVGNLFEVSPDFIDDVSAALQYLPDELTQDVGGGAGFFADAVNNIDPNQYSQNVLNDFNAIGEDQDFVDLFATTNTPDDVAAALVGPELEQNFQTYLDKYGEVTFDTPEGFVTYRADGTVETGTDEGRRSYYHTDPSGKNYFVDYSDINDPNAMVQTFDRSATGEMGRHYYFDGNYVGYGPKGDVTTAGPSGSGAAKTVYNRDGSVTEYKKDGSTVTHYKDGSKTTTSPSGQQTRTAAPTSQKQQSSWEKLLPMLLMLLAMRNNGGSTGGTQAVIPQLKASREQLPYQQIQQQAGYRPGQGGVKYISDVKYTPMAGGGVVDLAKALAAKRREQRLGLLKGRGDGVSDSIPAMIGTDQPARLARGEYVVDARTVAELGNGSTDAGAERLDEMRRQVHAKRKKAKVGQDSKAYKHLPK